MDLEQFNGSDSDLLNVIVSITNKTNNDVLFTKRYDGTSLIFRIVSGINYRVQVGALNGYFSATLYKDFSSEFGKNRTITFQYVKYGLYAYYQDGTIKTYDNATSSAIGVLFYTSKVRAVIDKVNLNGDGSTPMVNVFGNLAEKSLNDALNDFSGYENTQAILTVNSASYSPAKMCQARFNGNGYWPALGELEELWNNDTEFNKLMSKIGGQTMSQQSNQHKASSTNNWGIQWYSHTYTNEGWGSWVTGSDFVQFRAFMKI